MMTNTEYHVGAGIAGIYAGKLNKNKGMWLSKSDVTDEAIGAVCDYMRDRIEKGKTQFGYQWTLDSGRKVSLICKVEESIAEEK